MEVCSGHQLHPHLEPGGLVVTRGPVSQAQAFAASLRPLASRSSEEEAAWPWVLDSPDPI